jgi:endonuclease/exonuclease/phosphatase family metal-dependent hydrolase
MTSKWFGRVVLLLSVLTGTSHVQAAEGDADVRVMSFNIRYGTANDGENHWDRRQEFVVETIRAFDPDLLGTQETLGFQRDYLAENLSGYGHLGVGRDDGKDEGEMMALFYKLDRFEQLDGGHFWLSETPEVIGSKSWDSSLPRMVTWVKLRDRKNTSAPPVAFFNTHFDHRGQEARLESARLLRRRIAAIGEACSVIVTGDFNTAEGSEPYTALFDPMQDDQSPVVDTYRAVHSARDGHEATFSGFKAGTTSGSRIDWIGASRDWEVVSAAIDRTSRDGRTPSDHYPVTAVLRR